MFHCFEIGAIDVDLRRNACFSWRWLIQHLGVLQADGEAEVLSWVREMVENVP